MNIKTLLYYYSNLEKLVPISFLTIFHRHGEHGDLIRPQCSQVPGIYRLGSCLQERWGT